jgi:twitching motility protein PilT
LLSLVVAQGAESLALVHGRVPELVKGGQPKPLSMPPLAPELLARFIAEVRESGDEARYVFNGKGDPVAFDVVIHEPERMDFRRAGAASSPTVPSDPSTPGAADQMSATTGLAASPARRPAAASLERGSVSRLIREALDAEATDVFLSTSNDTRIRVDTELRTLPGSRLAEGDLLELADLDDARRARLEEHGSVDFGLRVGEEKLRVNLFRHRGGLAAALRPLRRIRPLTELGLPADLQQLSDAADGLVLLVGPTGSGKSTTIAALLDHLNQTRARHIVTIEDPIEFEHESRRCLVHQREVGRDVESFAAGLRAALRESPDVILVGEMRDSETFAAALTAAETGHLVLSTVHSGSAAMAIDRIIDSFPPHQQVQVRGQLASVLRAIVTQVLLPGVEPGRLVPAIERMHVTHAIAHKIRDSRGHQIGDEIHTGRADGMVSLEASLADLVRRGLISLATASGAARKPEVLREMLHAAASGAR